MHRTAVKKVIIESVLDANNAHAQVNRNRFDEAGNYVINLMSSPGAGKTALLERLRTEPRLPLVLRVAAFTLR
jgi:Ni2+-binding GTPase involved in maturation of urease and hydrogenase